MPPKTIAAALLLCFPSAFAADGSKVFKNRCIACHGADARGTGQGPGLAGNPRLSGNSVAQLRDIVERGFPNSGMPAFHLPPADLDAVARFVHSLNADTIVSPPPAAHLTWTARQPGDWPTYNGNPGGNRYSRLKRINTGNVAGLKLKWIFPIANFGLEVTPLAASGVLYVTGPNQVIALDALTGNQLWKWSRPTTTGLVGDASLSTNRGVAIRDHNVFYETDNAHLIALNRATGQLVWEKTIPETPRNYGGTMAPLVVKDTVLVGVAGADQGIRGFIACYRAATGELLWRRYTVPRRGEPGFETWKGSEPLLGGGSTWLTGAYDESTDTLYWPTGNPWPDSDPSDRAGDNLYTNCILALDPSTGKLKWHYQFTPADVADRDATEPPVLVDAVYQGTARKLLLHADRNGFFYVLDRTNGEVLLAKPFLRKVDWASGIGADGRPTVIDPRGCPDDAANWDSAAYSPATKLFYFLALEQCVDGGHGYPDQTGQRFLRALDIETGEIVWEVPQPGLAKAKTWSGVLATAGGLVFYGKPNGGFDAVDEHNGKLLWRFETNTRMKASPMTFEFAGRQYVAVAAGPNILCFGF